jgi:hypothetical protein
MSTSTQSGSGSSWSDTTTLANEFTDGMLRGKVISFIPPYPANWTANYAASFGSAFYSLDSNHYNASAGRMQYRFHITGQPHTSYWVTWDQVTTYPNNSAPSVQHLQEEIEGNGDPVNGAYGSVHTVDVPGTPCTITEGNIKVTSSNL